jgi:hypothetical protein
MRRRSLLSLAVLFTALPLVAQEGQPDDCSLEFTGSARKAVKLRLPSAGDLYTAVKSGQPITGMSRSLLRMTGSGGD